MECNNKTSTKFSELRKRAEKALENLKEPLDQLPAEDIYRLIEELRIHQIELEMQNEELQKAQEELEVSRSNYADLYDFAPVGYFTFDKNGLIVEVNLAGADMLGLERNQLIGKLFSHFIEKDNQNTFRIHRRKVFITDSKQTCELKLVRKDSSDLCTILESAAIMGENGHTYRCRTVITDITERKRAEEVLRESEERFRTLFEGSPDAFFLADIYSGKIIDANQAASKLLLKPRDKIIGLDLSQLHQSGEKQYSRENVKKMIFRGTRAKPIENTVVRSDGIEVPVEIMEHIVQLHNRPVLMGVFRDITKRNRTEIKLKKYSEKLEEMIEERTKELRDVQDRLIRQEKLTMLGQLAGGVGHELRNPLGAIKNAAYFLNMALEDPEPEIKESLKILEKEMATVERIIVSLLDFARPRPPTLIKININDLLHEVISHIGVPDNIQIINQLDETLPDILADNVQLERVFSNIILNAIQAMPQGGILHITSEVTRPRWVKISIADTGEGIPEENLDKIFEPLFTSKAKGIGFGLAITKSMVERHGGKITVKSEVGKGSTFAVKLPLKVKKSKNGESISNPDC
jgi:PAS domain S-box-containing protein